MAVVPKLVSGVVVRGGREACEVQMSLNLNIDAVVCF